MTPLEQQQWVDETLARLTVPPDDDSVPRVCLLDSGVNRWHPLLSPFLNPVDLHTVNPVWGVDDTANHGSGLAGLVAFGDLSNALATDEPIIASHRLESVKLTPEQGANAGDSKLHGHLFPRQLLAPKLQRHCAHACLHRRLHPTMTVTGGNPRRGRPPLIGSPLTTMAMVSFPACSCCAPAILKTRRAGIPTPPA